MAETMLSGLEGSAIKTGSALESLRIQIGETFEDFGVGFFNELTATFQAMNKELVGSEKQFKNLEEAGMMMAKGLVFAFEMIASAVALVADTIVDLTSGMGEGLMRIDNMVRGLRGGFGAEGILSQEERGGLQRVLDFGKGPGALDRVSNFFAQIDALLDPTSRATRQGATRGEGMDAFERALGFGRARSTAEDKPVAMAIGEQIASAIEEFIPVGFATEAPKAAAEEQVSGFTEGIQTALGLVKVDPTAAKKDSDNLQEIAKNTGGMFKEMLTRLESFT